MKSFRYDEDLVFETYNKKEWMKDGLDMTFVQENQSMSGKGVLRGLHVQKKFPQGKLVRVVRGVIYDVAVDIYSFLIQVIHHRFTQLV